MKTVAQNRRVKFDYEILETIEAGIMLTGPEVKSCRQGNVQLSGAYLSFQRGTPIIKKMKISQYAYAKNVPHEEERDRELLLKKSEKEKLQTYTDQRGIAVVPMEVRAGRFIKILLAVGRGRKKLDKRARIKERETEKKLRRGEEI